MQNSPDNSEGSQLDSKDIQPEPKPDLTKIPDESRVEASKTLDNPALAKELKDLKAFFVKNIDSFKTAGITEQQFGLAQSSAEQRIREEYAERERQDPLALVEAALQKAATTQTEINAIPQITSKFANIRQILARHPFQGDDYTGHDQLNGYANKEFHQGGTGFKYRVDFPYQVETPEGAVFADISSAMVEKFLKSVGSIEEDQTLEDHLRTLSPPQFGVEDPPAPYLVSTSNALMPKYEEDRQTGKGSAHARLLTNIPGVEVRVTPDNHTSLILTRGALQKAAANITSSSSNR